MSINAYLGLMFILLWRTAVSSMCSTHQIQAETALIKTVEETDVCRVDLTWLSEGESLTVEKSDKTSDTFAIYCVSATASSVNFRSLFSSTTIRLELNDPNYGLYVGGNVSQVYHLYETKSKVWTSLLYRAQPVEPSIVLSPFAPSCVGVETDDRYTIQLVSTELDVRLVGSLLLGICLLIFDRILLKSHAFQCLVGFVFGSVCTAGYIIRAYYLQLVKECVEETERAVCGGVLGALIGFFFAEQLHELFVFLMVTMWKIDAVKTAFLVSSSLFGLALCYRKGPVTNPYLVAVIDCLAIDGSGFFLIIHGLRFVLGYICLMAKSANRAL